MESIAAWGGGGCLRGCYECMGTGATRQILWNLSPLGGAQGDVMNAGLVCPGRDCGIYCRSGMPEGMLWMGVAWCDEADRRICHYSTLPLQVK